MVISPWSEQIHIANATKAHAAPAKKNGRNPPRKKGCDAAIRRRLKASICSPLVTEPDSTDAFAIRPISPRVFGVPIRRTRSGRLNRRFSTAFYSLSAEWLRRLFGSGGYGFSHVRPLRDAGHFIREPVDGRAEALLQIDHRLPVE